MVVITVWVTVRSQLLYASCKIVSTSPTDSVLNGVASLKSMGAHAVADSEFA